MLIIEKFTIRRFKNIQYIGSTFQTCLFQDSLNSKTKSYSNYERCSVRRTNFCTQSKVYITAPYCINSISYMYYFCLLVRKPENSNGVLLSQLNMHMQNF